MVHAHLEQLGEHILLPHGQVVDGRVQRLLILLEGVLGHPLHANAQRCVVAKPPGDAVGAQLIPVLLLPLATWDGVEQLGLGVRVEGPDHVGGRNASGNLGRERVFILIIWLKLCHLFHKIISRSF
jgi:hypothetical protein